MDNATVIANEDKDIAKYIYEIANNSGNIQFKRVGDPVKNPANAVDGDDIFVPFEFAVGDSIQVQCGEFNIGKEFIWNGSIFEIAQEKLNVNQAPLFKLYDSNGHYLGDEGYFPQNDFEGSKIFNYAVVAPANNSSTLASKEDSELDFKLVLKHFKQVVNFI